jgi:hypothetical protein
VEREGKRIEGIAAGWEIKNATDLLRLVFLYRTEGKSFSGTAALLKLAGIDSMTKKAVFTRFQKCAERLRWLCENVYWNNQAIPEVRSWLGDKKVYLVDASSRGHFVSDGTLVNFCSVCLWHTFMQKIPINGHAVLFEHSEFARYNRTSGSHSYL